MRKQILIFISILFSGVAFAQVSSHQVIGSTGSFYVTPEMSLAYTIGEPVVSLLQEGDYTLTQGFHQTACTITKIDKNPVSNIEFQVFPNPTTRFLNINGGTQGLTCSIYDMSGRMIFNEYCNSSNIALDLSYYSNGTYLLNLTDEFGQSVSKYKIVKK